MHTSKNKANKIDFGSSSLMNDLPKKKNTVWQKFWPSHRSYQSEATVNTFTGKMNENDWKWMKMNTQWKEKRQQRAHVTTLMCISLRCIQCFSWLQIVFIIFFFFYFRWCYQKHSRMQCKRNKTESVIHDDWNNGKKWRLAKNTVDIKKAMITSKFTTRAKLYRLFNIFGGKLCQDHFKYEHRWCPHCRRANITK